MDIDVWHRSVLPEPNSGCWIWTGAEGQGYGRVYYTKPDGRRATAMAHRVSYETAKGKIPSGLHLDHLCRNTLCVNPDHLEPVTCAENIRRGHTGLNNKSKTHCPQGHPYDEENTYFAKARGGIQRLCKACRGI